MLSAPIIAIVLYYITISAGMIVDRQRNRVIPQVPRGQHGAGDGGLRHRGLHLRALALVVGPILGIIVAQFIGRTYTFLVFSNRELLPVHITEQTLQFAALAVGLSMGAMMVPAWGAARHSIVTYKQEVARRTRGPFWQRWFWTSSCSPSPATATTC